MLKAIIFDFDGTILDTEYADFEAWRRVYAHHGYAFPLPLWQQNIGTAAHTFDPYAHLEALMGRPLDREEVREQRRALDEELIASLRPMDGVLDMISAAKKRGLRLGIASSSPARWLNYHLPRLGLLFEFEVVRTRTDVNEATKPAPDVYLAALAGLRVSADEAIAIEDSAHGVAAAKAAGLRVVAVPNIATKGMDFSAADLTVDSLAAVPLEALLIRLGLENGYADT